MVYRRKHQFTIDPSNKGNETDEEGEGSPVTSASDRLGESHHSLASSFRSLVRDERLNPGESWGNDKETSLRIELLGDLEIGDSGNAKLLEMSNDF